MEDTVEITLQQKGKAMLSAIARIRKLMEEKEKHLTILEFQSHLMLQGIDPKEVLKLGYDPIKDKRRKIYWNDPPLPEVFNVVYLKDGTKRDINPIPKPQES